MKKLIFFFFGILCYGIFFGTFLYMIGFIENVSGNAAGIHLSSLFPKTLDRGISLLSVPQAVIIDFLLIGLFGLQHSTMARWKFKQKWTKIIPKAIERSIYVLFASLALIVLFVCWQPVNMSIWDIRGSVEGDIALAISMSGWVTLLITTFLINHFDLFGLRQVYLNLVNREAAKIKFRTPLFYKVVRHPLYLSFILIFWFTPIMTVSHLLFAGAMTVNLIVGMNLEEKDLAYLYGDKYKEYQERIPKLLPFMKPNGKTSPVLEED